MDEYLGLIDNVFRQRPAPSDGAFRQLIELTVQAHLAVQSSNSSRSRWSQDALIQRITAASSGSLESIVIQRIALVLEALLDFVSVCPPISSLASRSRSSSTGSYGLQIYRSAHAKWGQLFNRSSSLFSLPQHSPRFFFPSFRYISSIFITLSIRLDVLEKKATRYPHLTDATGRLSGPVRAAGTDRTQLPGHETKRGAAMWLGNDCLRGYFKLNNLKLCETVLKSIREAVNRNREYNADSIGKGGSGTATGSAFKAVSSDSEGSNGEEPYSIAERVRYRYYLGRIRISQGRVREAFQHLQWALQKCPVHTTPQLRRILLHLLPTALVLGMRPSPALVEVVRRGGQTNQDVIQLYLPLFQAYAKPDMAHFQALMAERWRKERLRKLGVYLLLTEKCEAGMWRGIVKRCLLLSMPRAPSNPNAPPTLSIATLLKGVHFSTGLDGQQQQPSSATSTSLDTPPLRDVDLECIVASLIDQGYIKGYTFHSKGLLVFQKGETMGFPRVRDVY